MVNEQAVASTPEDHPDYGMYLNNLGNALELRFQRMGLMNDLDRAFMAIEKAIKQTPVGYPNRVGYLNNFGIVLHKQFDQTGSIDTLDRAITVYKEIITSIPNSHRDLAGYINNFANAIQRRFEVTGLLEDLDQAVTAYEQAIVSAPAISKYPVHGIYLGYGTAMLRHFEWTGSMNDLDIALKVAKEEATSSILNDHPINHPYNPIMLNNLGSAFLRRFERTGNIDDLDQAIRKYEEAVSTGMRDDLYRASRLNNLGCALQRRFQAVKWVEDIERAIKMHEESIILVPDNHPGRCMYLDNLGSAFRVRFVQTQSIDTLDHAIETYSQAVACTPDNNPQRATRLNNLGNALQSRFELASSLDDVNLAIATYEQAVAIDIAPPSIRLEAARSCSDLLIRQRMYTRAKRILEVAVHLLPTVSPRELKRSDQQFNISRWANIPSRAVSLRLADAEDPYKSLQLLELGRGIVANLQLETRSDITELAASHPDLANRFQKLRDQLDPPQKQFEAPVVEDVPFAGSSISALNHFESTSARRSLCKEFVQLLGHIRSLEGLQNFLQGPSEAEMHSLADGGSIVVFNVSEIRSDAFLVTNDKIQVVHLPRLTSDSVQAYTRRFLRAIREQWRISLYRKAMLEMNVILEWLWDVAVLPVLEELGYSQTPPASDVWPRVWWIGSGLLNILPIHASGYHHLTPPKTAIDRVISLYASTLKSLSYARERERRLDQDVLEDTSLLVAMPTTPGERDLPNVKRECGEIQKIFLAAGIDTTVTENPTRETVLSQLSNYSIVHFTCHGKSASDPSQSSLLLEDWESLPLTVLDLTSVTIKLGRFAYLSACDTSSMEDKDLMDESISLTSAVQLAGYPSVVGTLWQIMDNHAPEVAREVYKWSVGESGSFDGRQVAEALHKAVRNLRDVTCMSSRYGSDPLIWAPYIYVGM
jgi:tetratricopeptide (TPR) repeat protein